MKLRLVLPGALALVLVAGGARADTVVTTDGRRIEGTVSERDGKIVVSRRGIEIVLEKHEVEKIETGDGGVREAFEQKKAALAPGDAEARYALALWCKQKGLGREARQLLEEVVALAPDHLQARRDLGFVKDGDRWVPEDELRRKLGFEKVDGRWVPAAEARRARRTTAVRKVLLRVALNLARGGPRSKQAQAELDSLAADEPGLVAPLVEERLGEHDPAVRVALVELLGKLATKGSAPRLVALAFDDEDADVREASARALWASGDLDGRTVVVQRLYHPKQAVRDRAADVLRAAADPETVPYLVEALYLKGIRVVEVDEPTISRGGYGTVRAEGIFGGYNAPTSVSAGEVQLEKQEVYLYSKRVLAALKKITNRDFDFSKHDWWKWWEKEGRDKLIPKKPAPAPAPTPGAPK